MGFELVFTNLSNTGKTKTVFRHLKRQLTKVRLLKIQEIHLSDLSLTIYSTRVMKMKTMERKFLFQLILICVLFISCENAKRNPTKNMLVYTKTGEGYVHKNIANSVKAIQDICTEDGILTDVTNDPTTFTPENLQKYDAIFFANTSNNVFDSPSQKDAFQAFCRSGKGFGGIHAANTTERDWPWFVQLIGGKFVRHPVYQAFAVLADGTPDQVREETRKMVLDFGDPKRVIWSCEAECHKTSVPKTSVLLKKPLMK